MSEHLHIMQHAWRLRTPTMAEVKRYTYTAGPEEFSPMVVEEWPDGEFVQHSDYARLLDRVAELERERDSAQAELARLRAVEKAAKAMIEAGLADIDDAERAYDALAEACGRKP